MTLEKYADEEILHVANPIMDNLMDASTAIDHQRHIRDFSERMKIFVTKDTFRRSVRSTSRKRLFLAAGACRRVQTSRRMAIIWKQWFTKAPGEFVAEMLLVEKDGTFLVDQRDGVLRPWSAN